MTIGLLRHERSAVAGAILVLSALSWIYLVGGMPMGAMRPPLSALILMWWLMMIAMMLPSAAPAILLYEHVRRTRGSGSAAVGQPWIFMAGYLAVWLLFSIAAALAQSLLTGPAMALSSRSGEAAVLIAAGVYQLSPFKSVCLSQCRSPAHFISRHWRPGWEGAMRLGILHGAYCVGCCWLLMALLFVGGVMNLLWIVALAVLVAFEKILPRGDWLARAAGVGFIIWGAWRAVI